MLPSFADRCTVDFWGKQVDLEEGYLDEIIKTFIEQKILKNFTQKIILHIYPVDSILYQVFIDSTSVNENLAYGAPVPISAFINVGQTKGKSFFLFFCLSAPFISCPFFLWPESESS